MKGRVVCLALGIALVGLAHGCSQILIEIDPYHLKIGVDAGATARIQRTVTVVPLDGVVASWKADIRVPWVSVDPATSPARKGEKRKVTVTIDPAGLAPGTHTAHISFEPFDKDGKDLWDGGGLSVTVEVRAPAGQAVDRPIAWQSQAKDGTAEVFFMTATDRFVYRLDNHVPSQDRAPVAAGPWVGVPLASDPPALILKNMHTFEEISVPGQILNLVGGERVFAYQATPGAATYRIYDLEKKKETDSGVEASPVAPVIVDDRVYLTDSSGRLHVWREGSIWATGLDANALSASGDRAAVTSAGEVLLLDLHRRAIHGSGLDGRGHVVGLKALIVGASGKVHLFDGKTHTDTGYDCWAHTGPIVDGVVAAVPAVTPAGVELVVYDGGRFIETRRPVADSIAPVVRGRRVAVAGAGRSVSVYDLDAGSWFDTGVSCWDRGEPVGLSGKKAFEVRWDHLVVPTARAGGGYTLRVADLRVARVLSIDAGAVAEPVASLPFRFAVDRLLVERPRIGPDGAIDSALSLQGQVPLMEGRTLKDGDRTVVRRFGFTR